MLWWGLPWWPEEGSQVKPRNVSSSSVINLDIVGNVVESDDATNAAESWVSLWH